MTGMDQFLAQHFGTAASVTEPTAEDVEKCAQAELFLKLAAQNGIDIGSLNNEQIDALWGATFGKTAEEAPKEEEKKEEKKDERVEMAKAEHEKAKEGQAKVAEATEMGKMMAHSYVEELRKIAEAGGLDFLKQAEPEPAPEVEKDKKEKKKEKKERKEQEKKEKMFGKAASAIDTLAADLAVKKAEAAGWDVEQAVSRLGALFTLGAAESEKIAQVSDLNGAIDVRSSELLEMAGYPIDWSGTPFEKKAEEELKVLPGHALKPEGPKTGGKMPEQLKEGLKEHLGAKVDIAKARGKGYGLLAAEWAKKHPGKAGLAGVGAAAALGAGAYGAHKLLKGKKEPEAEKAASVQFDVTAGEMAVQKAAAAGWDADEAVARIDALFTLGAEGEPEQSEKVATAQSAEQAMEFRACELLELAGYPIKW